MAQNYFSQIDWNSPDAQAEFDKRNSMNDQIKFLQQMVGAAGDDESIKRALFSQYMGLVNPDPQAETQQQQDQMGMAMDLMASGDPESVAAAKKMLASNPLLSQYFGSTPTPESNVQQTLQDAFKTQAQGDFAVDATNPQEATRNTGILSQIEQNPDLASQYYNEKPSAMEWMGAAKENLSEVPWWTGISPLLSSVYGAGSAMNASDRAKRKNVFGINN